MANQIATRSVPLEGLEYRDAAVLEDTLLDLTLSLLSQVRVVRVAEQVGLSLC